MNISSKLTTIALVAAILAACGGGNGGGGKSTGGNGGDCSILAELKIQHEFFRLYQRRACH